MAAHEILIYFYQHNSVLEKYVTRRHLNIALVHATYWNLLESVTILTWLGATSHKTAVWSATLTGNYVALSLIRKLKPFVPLFDAIQLAGEMQDPYLVQFLTYL